MARNYTTLDQIVSDYIITMEGDDYGNNASDTLIRTYAKRGIREMGFDMSNRIRSLKLSINSANNTVELPDDYVDLVKIGVIGADGLVYVYGENKNLHIAQKYDVSAGNDLVAANASDSDNDGVYDRVDVDSPTVEYDGLRGYDSYVFRNYLYENTMGALYGLGGGVYTGEYRINLDQNRIELSAGEDIAKSSWNMFVMKVVVKILRYTFIWNLLYAHTYTLSLLRRSLMFHWVRRQEHDKNTTTKEDSLILE